MIENVQKKLSNLDLKEDWDKILITAIPVLLYFEMGTDIVSASMQKLALIAVVAYSLWLK